MLRMTSCLAFLAAIGLATAASGQDAKPSLEQLIQKFHSDAPKREADVTIDAWIEPGDGEASTLVITLQPDGDTKLNADPGITVTPADQGLDWQLALPHRHQDMSTTYFNPPATVEMPFSGVIGQPVEVLVEYAYCFVDYQCFFGEETLRVDMDREGGTPGGTG
ncbi:MAG: hypothetical protein AAGC99_01265 [Pseudomonadota bacterium]